MDRYTYETTADQAAEILKDQIQGKVVVITGISINGLGADAARAVFKQNPKLLVLASRSSKNIGDVIKWMAPDGSDKIKPLTLDLVSQSSCREAGAELLKLTPVVDVLINNAGVMMLPKFQVSPEGIEYQFAINHIGHFLFTNLIMGALLKSSGGPRVVSVSSRGHHYGEVSLDNYNFDDGKSYDPMTAYGRSKSANILFAVELAKRYGSKGLVAFGVHPGAIIETNLSRNIPDEEMEKRGWMKDGKPAANIGWKSVGQGAAGYVIAGFDPTIADRNGGYIANSEFTEAAAHATDPVIAEKLWALSENLVGQQF